MAACGQPLVAYPEEVVAFINTLIADAYKEGYHHGAAATKLRHELEKKTLIADDDPIPDGNQLSLDASVARLLSRVQQLFFHERMRGPFARFRCLCRVWECIGAIKDPERTNHLLIIAADVIANRGGYHVQKLIRAAKAHKVPCVTSLPSEELGKFFGKNKNIACVLFVDDDGVQPEIADVLQYATM